MEVARLSKFVYDSLNAFTDGYIDCADVIASGMLYNLGMYDMYRSQAPNDRIVIYTNAVNKIHHSYIWSDLYEVSDKLRYSFLYKTTYEAVQSVIWMCDDPFTSEVKSFKEELVHFLREHAVFLACCDMEQCSAFLYSNGTQAISHDTFVQEYATTSSALRALFKKYDHKVPRIMMSIINVLMSVIDVREKWREELIVAPNIQLLPKLDKLNESQFNAAMALIPSAGLNTFRSHLELLYTHLVPFHVISTLKWLITMHGHRLDTMPSLLEYVGQDRVNTAKKFVHLMRGYHNNLCLKGEIVKLPFMTHIARLMDDQYFFEAHTLVYLGDTSITILGNAIKLYLRNVPALVMGDLLFAGFFDALIVEHHPEPQYIATLISKLQTDLEQFEYSTTSCTIRCISVNATRTLQTCLKKLQRYYKKLLALRKVDNNDDLEDASSMISLIFGEVYDDEGNPQVCSVCLDNCHERKDTWWKLPCKHMLHMECVAKLLQTKYTTCPLCRQSMTC